MSLIWNGIQGGYAYLLVAQILIVTGLVLSLLFLVVKRTMDSGVGLAATQNHQVSESAGLAAQAASVMVASGVAAGTSPPAAAAKSLDADIEKVFNEKKNLEDKVKFLESKLLEYEILQEEISTLSALKIENEKLKQKVQQMGGELSPADKIEEKLIFDPPKEAVAANPAVSDAPQGEKAIEDLLQDIDNLTKS
jgi:hypothetical protein